jgi:5,10-methenyltetrahydromethanopterin hydrogenase
MSDKTEVPDKPETSDKPKPDKLGAGDMVLNWLIPGGNVKDIFDVTISNANNNRVSSLAEAIRNRRLDLFKDIDSSRLKLYKNKEYAESVIINILMKDNVAILDGTEWMDPENAIYNYFNGRPKLSFQGTFSIFFILI